MVETVRFLESKFSHIRERNRSRLSLRISENEPLKIESSHIRERNGEDRSEGTDIKKQEYSVRGKHEFGIGPIVQGWR